MTGALRHLLGDAGAGAAVGCQETQCAAQGHDRCRFEFGVGRD
jgi:predicted hydrocarbon binding protein